MSSHGYSARYPVAQITVLISPERSGSSSRGTEGTLVGAKRSGGSASLSSPCAAAHPSRVSSNRDSFKSANMHWLGSEPEN